MSRELDEVERDRVRVLGTLTAVMKLILRGGPAELDRAEFSLLRLQLALEADIGIVVLGQKKKTAMEATAWLRRQLESIGDRQAG